MHASGPQLDIAAIERTFAELMERLRRSSLVMEHTIYGYPVTPQVQGTCTIKAERRYGMGYRTVRHFQAKQQRRRSPQCSPYQRDHVIAVVVPAAALVPVRPGFLRIEPRRVVLEYPNGQLELLLAAPLDREPRRQAELLTLVRAAAEPDGDPHRLPMFERAADPVEVINAWDAWVACRERLAFWVQAQIPADGRPASAS